MPRGIPTFTKLEVERIEIRMRLPSGMFGMPYFGKRAPGESQRVILEIDRTFGVRVLRGHLVLAEGALNAGSVTWTGLPENVIAWRLCPTALAMAEAQVLATGKLFRRYYLDPRWLDVRAQIEVLGRAVES